MGKCEKKKFHNWEVISIGGELPHQELELQCSECDAKEDVSFEV